MASGLTHTTATLCASSAVVSYYGLTDPHSATAWLVAGLWCTIIQPDLDQIDNGGYYGLYILERTGKGIERFWRAYWYPYSKLKHRSFFSHFPFVGSVIRLLYGGWFIIPFLWQWQGFHVFVTAVISMDFLHWVMDWKLWGVFGIFKQ